MAGDSLPDTCEYCKNPRPYVECACSAGNCGAVHCMARPSDGTVGLDESYAAVYGLPRFLGGNDE